MIEDHQLTPFRFREVGDQMLISNEVGEYGLFDSTIIDRFFGDALTNEEVEKFQDLSILIATGSEWRVASLMRRVREKLARDANALTYLIIVPTLRCDLACSYCQVSRAPLDAVGFDWGEEELHLFSGMLDNLESNTLKLEFQGGEPTLRPDLLSRVIEICSQKFDSLEFVICTNLTRISSEMEKIIERDDVYISTSIDGPLAAMTANRTTSDETSQKVFDNFRYIVDRYGPDKVSALPTITDKMIDDPTGLVDVYLECGFSSIFLRPVNYMGFARKNYAELSHEYSKWNRFYRQAFDYIIQINKDRYFEEYYASLIVRSIFGDMPNGFVDFRSPSRFVEDYCVIDFDGKIYPSDEARMLTRTNHIDLSIGTLRDGIDQTKVSALNSHAINQTHPDCLHCAYMPYCGIDIIDDISRYGRMDLPKSETWFCNKQMGLFDLIFEKVAAREKKALDVFLKWIFHSQDPPPAYQLFYDRT